MLATGEATSPGIGRGDRSGFRDGRGLAWRRLPGVNPSPVTTAMTVARRIMFGTFFVDCSARSVTSPSRSTKRVSDVRPFL